MKQKQFVENVRIRQEENGYVLALGGDNHLPQESYVFQSFAELVDFLSKHFTHRNESILTDKQK